MTDQLFTESQCKVFLTQIQRRCKYRQEFLKARTDPCKHSMEAGYVFDTAIQNYMSMKTCQFEYFRPGPRQSLFGLIAMAPMFIYGSMIYIQRREREKKIRSGELRYKDRMFKLA